MSGIVLYPRGIVFEMWSSVETACNGNVSETKSLYTLLSPRHRLGLGSVSGVPCRGTRPNMAPLHRIPYGVNIKNSTGVYIGDV